MKILITGGAGFIGSHIVDTCVQRGYSVVIIDNLSSGQRSNIAHHEGNASVHFYEADICDTTRMQEIFQIVQPEAVFHLAAQINVRESIKNPSYDIKVNIGGTLSVLEAMRSV